MIVGINFIALPAEKGSGAFRYIQQMLKAMGEYNFLNCEFVIYKQKQISESYIGIPSNLKVTYINVPTLGSGIRRIIFEQTLFYFYIKPCDVFYSYCTSMPLFVRAKRVFTLHDVYYYILKSRYVFLQRAYLKLITRLYVYRTDKIITVSDFSKKTICKYLNVDATRISVTYNFVIPNQVRFDRGLQLDNIEDVCGNKLSIARTYFLYIGNLQPGKNIKGMVDGYCKFAASSKNAPSLFIVGKLGTSGEELAQYLKEKKGVFYLGYVSREVVDVLLANCVAVVLLSFCEGFGIPPLEGFGYGKPALVSNRTSLPEVVGKAGVIVDPDDILSIASGFNMIYNNPNKYTKYIDEQLQKFYYKNSVEKFMHELGVIFTKIE